MKIFKKFEAKNGKKVILRSPERTDVQQLLRHINSLVRERAPILEDRLKTLKEERKWLRDLLNKIKKRRGIAILAECDGKIVGMAQAFRERNRSSHVAELGIGVAKEYRRLGIGKNLMAILLELVKKRFKGVQIVQLTAFESNTIAIPLYKKFGFKKVAAVPRMLRSYRDERKFESRVYMHLQLKKYKPSR